MRLGIWGILLVLLLGVWLLLGFRLRLGLGGGRFGFGRWHWLRLALGHGRRGRDDGGFGISSSCAAVGQYHAFQFARVVLGVKHDEVEARAVE